MQTFYSVSFLFFCFFPFPPFLVCVIPQSLLFFFSTRIYPKGARLDSSNYNPFSSWTKVNFLSDFYFLIYIYIYIVNVIFVSQLSSFFFLFFYQGCQMVALNWQTKDGLEFSLQDALFSTNEGCGYVLKPPYLMDEVFFPSILIKCYFLPSSPHFTHSHTPPLF